MVVVITSMQDMVTLKWQYKIKNKRNWKREKKNVKEIETLTLSIVDKHEMSQTPAHRDISQIIQ